MRANRITPDTVTKLKPGEVFVFGSNEAGRHGKGAAKLARDKFGAQQGQGVGLFGQTYAIPTKDSSIKTLPIDGIAKYVEEFISCTKQMPDTVFLVTEIGCGLAGHSPADIAPLFEDAVNLANIHLPARFWDVLEK
jgi:hypothetical protein